VKPNRHLGEMSSVKKVPEKQREGICPKSHGGNSVYVPKSPEMPKNTQQDNYNGDVHIDDGTAEEEKGNTQPNRTKSHDANSKRQPNWVRKGDIKKDDSDKGDSKKTNNQDKGPI
jgi:hypothetical protein